MTEPRFESQYPKGSYFSQIHEIISFVKSGKSVEVIGLPGVGRSNLFQVLTYDRNVRIAHLGEDQTKFHFVLVNFSEVKEKPTSEIIKYIFLSIVDSLRLREILKDEGSISELETASSIFQKSVKTHDDLVILNALKRTLDFLAIEKNLNIIFLFDRFEEFVPFASEEFFQNLRSFQDRVRYKFSVVFSLKRPLEEVLEPQIYSPFYEFFQNNTVYLPVRDDESLNFRIKHLEKIVGHEISQKIIEKTICETAGHGKLTRVILENFTPDGDPLSIPQVQLVLQEIWKSFSPQEQTFLKNPNSETPPHLLKVGIWDEKITIPLFDEFVKTIEIEKEKYVIDKSKNEIKKGNVLISNGLTKLEFHLLKYLIENAGNIVTRDDAIQASWGEQKSTAGVTEQALDQLVLRLRKKIEENPNSPKLIQTIKGRGIVFRQ